MALSYFFEFFRRPIVIILSGLWLARDHTYQRRSYVVWTEIMRPGGHDGTPTITVVITMGAKIISGVRRVGVWECRSAGVQEGEGVCLSWQLQKQLTPWCVHSAFLRYKNMVGLVSSYMFLHSPLYIKI